MAKLNIIDGSLRGKLGQMVGFRWKNKNVVRTHVKPTDPKTEKQKYHRTLFAQAVKNTQEAMIINRGFSLWQSEDRTEYQNRMSQSMLDIKKDILPVLKLPIYPPNTTYTYQFDNAQLHIVNLETIFLKVPNLETLPVGTIVYLYQRTFNKDTQKLEDIKYTYATVVDNNEILLSKEPQFTTLDPQDIICIYAIMAPADVEKSIKPLVFDFSKKQVQATYSWRGVLGVTNPATLVIESSIPQKPVKEVVFQRVRYSRTLSNIIRVVTEDNPYLYTSPTMSIECSFGYSGWFPERPARIEENSHIVVNYEDGDSVILTYK